MTKLSACLLITPLAALHLNGATNSDSDQKAAALFTKNYSFHAWNETDHTVDGEDWSLPLWVKPAPYSGVQIKPNLVSAEFPARIQRGVSASWRETETQTAKGQSSIRFGLDEAFLAGGPHAVAVKITYLDRANAEWQLEYFTDAQKITTRKVTCGDSGAAKTVTFILNAACFPGTGHTGLDMQICALKGDAVIRMVRLIKLNPQTVKPSAQLR